VAEAGQFRHVAPQHVFARGAPVILLAAVLERILVVDDEPDLLELVRVNLDQSGLRVDTAQSGREALEKLRQSPPDLLILDLMLPDVSGTEICRRVRSDPDLAHLPIIMLTAKADEVDRVVGLELGADDYVTKPFSPRELVLRARAVLRRKQPQWGSGEALVHGSLRLDPERHRCFVDEREVGLTAKEFELLHVLMTRRGRVLTRDHLLEHVWGSDIAVTTRTIDTHLKRLREKLGDAGDLIETVRGVGYRFSE
jgi:two-component system phosphate regulon response regulator PhoB